MNGKVIGPSEKPDGRKTRLCFVKTSLQRTWVTIIEAINAEGNYIPPVVIFKGESVQAQWFPTKLEEFETWQFTASPNGWTSNDLGHEWLTTHFLPRTAPGNKDWRLLVLDGHGSHVSDDFITSCAANRVYLVLLPPHSSHVTQPLDVAVFSPLKTFYRRLLEEFCHKTLAQPSISSTSLPHTPKPDMVLFHAEISWLAGVLQGYGLSASPYHLATPSFYQRPQIPLPLLLLLRRKKAR